METTERTNLAPRAERPVQWLTGFQVALAIAAIFLLVSRGIPWASSGLVSQTVMGREIKDPGAIQTDITFLAIILHFVASLLYASIMLPLIHRFQYSSAALVGAGMGVILYLLNLALFTIVGGGAPYSRETAVFITHLAFGLVFTGAYKGMVKRRVMAPA